MMQSELDKAVNAVEKELAAEHGWKFSRGFIFKATDYLFLSIVGSAGVRSQNLYQMLQFKTLAFDELFWKIVRLEENARRPLGFRAFGAWVAPLTTIYTSNFAVNEWQRQDIRAGVGSFIGECDLLVADLCKQIRNPAENLSFLEKHEALRQAKYPNGHSNIWCARVLTAILESNFDLAKQMIDDRRRQGDSGGFVAERSTFYDLAYDYIQGST